VVTWSKEDAYWGKVTESCPQKFRCIRKKSLLFVQIATAAQRIRAQISRKATDKAQCLAKRQPP
jgi:hypothetical protein